LVFPSWVIHFPWIRTHDKLTCQMEIRLLLDEKVLWAQSVAEMETNMALNYSVLLRSPSPDATVQVWFLLKRGCRF